MTTNQKLGQSDLVYRVYIAFIHHKGRHTIRKVEISYRSSCLYACATSRALQPKNIFP